MSRKRSRSKSKSPEDVFTIEEIKKINSLYELQDFIGDLNEYADKRFDDPKIQNEINEHLIMANAKYTKIYNSLIENAKNEKVEKMIQMHAPIYTPPKDTAMHLTKTATLDELDIQDLRKYLGDQDLTQPTVGIRPSNVSAKNAKKRKTSRNKTSRK
jgi:hypothetical protein